MRVVNKDHKENIILKKHKKKPQHRKRGRNMIEGCNATTDDQMGVFQKKLPLWVVRLNRDCMQPSPQRTTYEGDSLFKRR